MDLIPDSLRSRLIVSITLVLILILVLGSMLVYWHAVHEVDVELRAAVAVGENTIHNAVDDVEEATTPLRHLELLVADFNGDRHLRASLVDHAQHVIYRSTALVPSDPAPEWFYRLLAARSHSARIVLPPPFDQYGAILLETNSRNEISEVWGDVVLTLAILGIFCGLNAVLVYWVVGYALRPLDALSSAFTALGAGKYHSRVPEFGTRELVHLCRSFNQMAEKLAQAEWRRHRLERQLAAVQDEERSELARDLHDEIGPLLFAVNVDLSVIQQDQTVRHTPVAAQLESVRDSMGKIYRDVKEILGRLRAPTLVDLGLAQAVQNLLIFWRTRYPDVSFHFGLPEETFGPQIDDAIYHIIMESLSNALRHGAPTRIEIQVMQGHDHVLTTIRDDGTGFKPKEAERGFGLSTMQERVQALAGTLTIANSGLGSGVVVTAWLPLRGQVLPDSVRSTSFDNVAAL